MTDRAFLLDTNAVIYLVTQGNVIPADLERELNEADLFVSVITEIELFAKPQLEPDEEKNLRDFLTDRVTTINITNNVKETTIALRRSAKLKLPDCIIAATAIARDIPLLTADESLLQLNRDGY